MKKIITEQPSLSDLDCLDFNYIDQGIYNGDEVKKNIMGTRFTTVARNTIDYWTVSRNNKKPQSQQEFSQHVQNLKFSQRPIHIYIHIPFCKQKCLFCAFNKGEDLCTYSYDDYIECLIDQYNRFLDVFPNKRPIIGSIHIGGGSPNIIGAENIRHLISQIKKTSCLDGNNTEISVEFSLPTVDLDFLDALFDSQVSRISMGIQTMDSETRKAMKLPPLTSKLNEILYYLNKKIPVINIDLITGFPEHTLRKVLKDHAFFIEHPVVNSISSYLLNPAHASGLLQQILYGTIKKLPSHEDSALFRLHTILLMRQKGWVRNGTNTYVNPGKIIEKNFNIISGRECIGSFNYDDCLFALGASSIGSLPGCRFENIRDPEEWIIDIKKGGYGIDLGKTYMEQQNDLALWSFPLNSNGISKKVYNEFIENNAIASQQDVVFRQLIDEGLIYESEDHYSLTILGEIFMGHIVRLLKNPGERGALDKEIKNLFLSAKNNLGRNFNKEKIL
ncbi:MAG: radical SAM protein [Oligoflexia bacterium]|nr:radical SAM protein [Oligoflexia bacterium]